jgi:hypothetical protein
MDGYVRVSRVDGREGDSFISPDPIRVAGRSRSGLAKIERGRRTWPETARRLSKALGIPSGDLRR